MRKVLRFICALILIMLFVIECSRNPVSKPVTASSSDALSLDCKKIVIKNLVSAQDEVIGTVRLEYEEGLLKVRYWIPEESEWSLSATHVYAGTAELQEARPDRFTHTNANPNLKSDVFYIPVQHGTCIGFSAHADVQRKGIKDSAWADDDYTFKQGSGKYGYIFFTTV